MRDDASILRLVNIDHQEHVSVTRWLPLIIAGSQGSEINIRELSAYDVEDSEDETPTDVDPFEDSDVETSTDPFEE